MSKIQLILKTDILPEVTVKVNDQVVESTIIKDEYDNLQLIVNATLVEHNQIGIEIHNTGTVNLIEIIVDDIRFGLVTFLCTTVNATQNTQVSAPGRIDVVLQAPIWKFWCDKMSEFNYERYPLGSTA
jgi:hypothetical protein